MKNEIFQLCKQARELYLLKHPDGPKTSWMSLIDHDNFLKTYIDSSGNEAGYQSIEFCGIEINPLTEDVKITLESTDLNNFKPVTFNLSKWINALKVVLTIYAGADGENQAVQLMKEYTQKKFLDEELNNKGVTVESLFYEKYKTKAEILDDLLNRNVHFNQK
jgi:hypothetical protein